MRDRRDFRLLAGLLCMSLLSAFVRPALAEDKADAARKPDNKFLRFVDDGDGGGRLEAAITTYQKGDVKVHLVSAVHVGEKKYYDDLGKTFQGYDSLLYEMVKPKDAPVPGRARDPRAWSAPFSACSRNFWSWNFSSMRSITRPRISSMPIWMPRLSKKCR